MNKCFKTRNNDQWATPSNIYNYICCEHDFIDFNIDFIDCDLNGFLLIEVNL